MIVIFLFPLVFSVFGMMMFVVGDYSLTTKSFYGILTISSVVLQFVPVFQENVHFLVPLFVQLFVCASWYFASQFE